MDVESGWQGHRSTGAEGRPLVGAGVATPPMAHQETQPGAETDRDATRGAAEGAMAAARLWGGPATEIEILEISVGVRMVK